jgi:hypothetical protein
VTARPLRDARMRGLRVDVCDLGDWAPHALLAEYDRAGRTIRVSARAFGRARSRGGAAAGRAFLCAAVAHELYHHAVAEGDLPPPAPRAGCAAPAAAFTLARYGLDVQRVAAALQ